MFGKQRSFSERIQKHEMDEWKDEIKMDEWIRKGLEYKQNIKAEHQWHTYTLALDLYYYSFSFAWMFHWNKTTTLVFFPLKCILSCLFRLLYFQNSLETTQNSNDRHTKCQTISHMHFVCVHFGIVVFEKITTS